MIKRLTYIILTSLLLAACSSGTVIPDEELSQIFHDAFLANAATGGDNRIYKKDSMLLYEPIFEKYGYTKDDVHYTIGNFSKRKSARLSDVVERAIAMLEQEGIRLNREVAILDTIDIASQRRLREVRYELERLELRELRDTASTFITIEDIHPGSYTVSFDYLIDKSDETSGTYSTSIWFEQDDKTTKYNRYNSYLNRRTADKFTHSMRASEDYDRLQIRLAEPRITTVTELNATLKNIRVLYIPTAKSATERLFNDIMQFRLFSDELLTPPTKDSL